MTALAPAQREACRAVLETHARTFSLAARFLAAETADHAAAVYAWCRRADDAVDHSPRREHAAALRTLRAELDAVYGPQDLPDPLLGGLQRVVRARSMRRSYFEELLEGMRMDAEDVRYRSVDDLRVYCYRVAGTVGLMMAHVLGVRDERALPAAAHLGMAMQLTNICRDLAEDHARKRCYVPEELLGEEAAAAVRAAFGGPLPASVRPAMGRARRTLLALADRYYASADRGLDALDWRSALGIRLARLGYAGIGDEIARRGHGRLERRAYVPRRRKLLLVLRALGASAAELPRRVRQRVEPVIPTRKLGYGDVQLDG